MACSEYNPCHEPTCNDCSPTNPCYENCGCVNPTTFECITNIKQNYTHIPLLINETGDDLLVQLNNTINTLKLNQFIVKADDSDTCPDSLFDKIEAGNENLTIEVTGSGCDRKLVISAGDGIGTAGVDRYVKISANDTTSDYLGNKVVDGTYVKKSVIGPGLDEKIKFDITINDLISTEAGNQLTLGLDGKLKTSFSAPDGTETKVVGGSGVSVVGIGSITNPYVISNNGTILRYRPCFDDVWKTATLVITNPNITAVSQSVSYKVRYDGAIEFKGNAVFTVIFNSASTGIVTSNNLFVIPSVTNLPCSTCCSSGGNPVAFATAELTKVSDLKYVNYNDPTNVVDALPKMYGYTVRLGGGNLVLVFQSTFAATKTINVSFDGCVYHPNLI